MNVLADVADARVLAGTSVTFRYLSGNVVLQTMVDFDQTRSQLTDHIKILCMENAYIPMTCVRLEWAQPVRLQSPDGFELGQPSMHMEGTLVPAAIPEDIVDSNFVHNTCLVCSDWALDVDVLKIDRSLNCVRCVPCALCDKCRITIAGQPVCLQCLEPSELELLGEKHRRRRSFVT